jgi:hypothetical protein
LVCAHQASFLSNLDKGVELTVEESSFFALDSHQQLSGFSPDSLPFESSGDDVAHDQNVRTVIPCFGPRGAMARASSRPFGGHEISR